MPISNINRNTYWPYSFIVQILKLLTLVDLDPLCNRTQRIFSEKFLPSEKYPRHAFEKPSPECPNTIHLTLQRDCNPPLAPLFPCTLDLFPRRMTHCWWWELQHRLTLHTYIPLLGNPVHCIWGRKYLLLI